MLFFCSLKTIYLWINHVKSTAKIKKNMAKHGKKTN